MGKPIVGVVRTTHVLCLGPSVTFTRLWQSDNPANLARPARVPLRGGKRAFPFPMRPIQELLSEIDAIGNDVEVARCLGVSLQYLSSSPLALLLPSTPPPILLALAPLLRQPRGR